MSAVLVVSLSGGTALADEEYLAVGVGAFDLFDNQTTAEFRAEYWSGFQLFRFGSFGDARPFGGVMFTGDTAAYAYAGLRMGFPVGRNLTLTASFAPGAFHHGDGKHLGHGLEFRSEFAVDWRFAGGGRLGLAFSHMSNAGIGDSNPGAESLMLTYAQPLSVFYD